MPYEWRVRTSQPLDANVGLDPSWVARGLDSVSFNGNLITKSAGPVGPGGPTVATGTNAAGPGVSATANTFFVVAVLSAVATDAVAYGRIRYSGSANYGAGLRFNNATLEYDFGNATSGWSFATKASTVAVGRNSYAGSLRTAAGHNGIALYKNGERLTSLSSAGSTGLTALTKWDTSLNLGQGNASGATAITGAVGGGIEIGAHFSTVLLDADIKELHNNPWQLFEPELVWVPAAAGGAYTLAADSASYTLTGQTTGLAFNRVLTADTQSFALTGQTTGLAFNRTLAADSGSFALTGQDAGLAFNRVLSAENGSYALDGQDATLTYTPISGATYTLTAASGSFALTGQDTGLAFNRVLTADTQSYSLSGQTAGLAFNRVLTADTVSYALTGQDAALTYTSNGFTYTLTAESGSFEVIGQDASLQHTTTAIAGGGGWLPQTRRKSRKQIYEERVKLGILPPPVIKAAAKVAAVAQTVEEFKEERPKYEEMFLKAIKKTEWLPDYTRAIQAQLAIMELEEEELLLLL